MKLLLGVSGDDRSMDTLEWAIQRATAAGDQLTVALVDRPGTDPNPDRLQAVRDRLESAGLDPDVRELAGEAGSELVALAERENYDQLVIRGGDKSPMGKIDLDRLEEYVLLNCQTSVTIVR